MRRIVVGAGGQGRVVLENWRAQHPGDTFVFVDDDNALHGRKILGAEVVGGLAELAKGGEAVLAIGNNAVRLRLAETPGVAWGRVIHPSAVVMPSATIGPGSVIFAGAVVNTQARIDAHVIVNTGSIIEHDCILEDGASISPGCRMGGRAFVGRGAFLSTGVTLGARVRVGAGTVVGAGSVVVRDLPENVLAYGVPARAVGSLDGFDWSRVL